MTLRVTRDDVIDFLDRIVEYMKERQDADGDINGRFYPNEEMKLLLDAERLLEGKWDFIKEPDSFAETVQQALKGYSR